MQHSPVKNNPKKTRKANTFSQPAVQSEVGDFKGGYFVMLDSAASKETDNNSKSRNNTKQERSPGRRKHQATESTAISSPNMNKDRHAKLEFENGKKPLPSPYVNTNKDLKKQDLTTPVSLQSHNNAKMYHYDSSPTKNVSSPQRRDSLSTSPTSAGRWAGPAFGNAPPPSSLPLPEFPPMTPPAVTHQPLSQALFSPHGSYPQVHSAGFLPLSASPPHYPSTSPPNAGYYSSIPAIPFPYIPPSSAAPSPMPTPSLTQLSTDLRRLLNIDAALDPILVSANSS